MISNAKVQDLLDAATALNMRFDEETAAFYLAALNSSLALYRQLDCMSEPSTPIKYPRSGGMRPSPQENPFNAWAHVTEIRGMPQGPLKGKRVAIKDNIAVAGIPMLNGSSSLAGYVPDLDATVVERILDAGGTIAGKANCEYLCLSGGSHTCATGPVRNPRNPAHSAGGSSSGSAALVAAGDVDMAIGGDQGGSIRIPASFCGIYGMKPTYGLVPYTGAMPIEFTLDTLGPMTRNAADNALLLEVLAGSDGLDPRQSTPQANQYTAYLGRPITGLRIGVVAEGFGWPESESAVDEKIRSAARRLEQAGAQLVSISIPIHRRAMSVWQAIAVEGILDTMMLNGFGTNSRGLFMTSLISRHRSWRDYTDAFSPSLTLALLTGTHVRRKHQGLYYAKAQNIARRITAEYDNALAGVDILLMPTTPMKATPLPEPGDRAASLQRSNEMLANTAPFNITGHPALSIPAGVVEGLPTSMMLVARNHREGLLYQVASAFEQACDWRSF